MSKVFYQLLITMTEDLIVSWFSTEANNSVAGECQMNLGVKKWTSMTVGTGQHCHVRRLAFYFIISCYLMQHKPLWRSKFRILRIKKTRTKIGTLRISHTSSRLDLRKIGAITDKVWWLSRAYKCSPRRGFRGFAFVCICILLSFYH